ncbi:hypothetical protein D9M68_875220 [compost metagenome]
MTVAKTGAHHHGKGDWATTTPKAIPIGTTARSAGKESLMASLTSPATAGATGCPGVRAAEEGGQLFIEQS